MSNLTLSKYGHEYCQPCRMLAPVLEQIKTEFSDKITVMDYNTYTMDPIDLAKANLKAVPTLILQKDGNEVWRNIGLLSKDQITAKLNEYL